MACQLDNFFLHLSNNPFLLKFKFGGTCQNVTEFRSCIVCFWQVVSGSSMLYRIQHGALDEWVRIWTQYYEKNKKANRCAYCARDAAIDRSPIGPPAAAILEFDRQAKIKTKDQGHETEMDESILTICGNYLTATSLMSLVYLRKPAVGLKDLGELHSSSSASSSSSSEFAAIFFDK